VNREATKTDNTIGQNLAGFSCLSEALDYAAAGVTGCNFYDAKGRLSAVVPYSELRQQARLAAQRLLSLDLKRGDHVALVADTHQDFIVLFFACQYIGLVPFAMPIPLNLGSHAVYVQQLKGMLTSGRAKVAIAHKEFISFLEEAAVDNGHLEWIGTPEQLADITPSERSMEPSSPEEPAYLQFTSGSTRSPQGVIITGKAVMSNLQGITRSGLRVHNGDRCASWLPFYHDMGLVGFVLGPIASQLSVDYLRTRDFAIRPLQWLRLISRNRCTIAFSPPFGYELCTRRIRSADLQQLDLSCWRIAGIGAEMLRSSTFKAFAETMSETSFDSNAFLPCYGLAEASLAATFSELDCGLDVMSVDALTMAERGIAVRMQSDSRKVNEIVNCGSALPEHEIRIVDNDGELLPDLRVGRVLVKGPSLMSGYLDDREATERVILENGWLDTGDLGYMHRDNLYLTGRRKDIIIVNGRNIRAQDLEEIAEEIDEIRMGESSAFDIETDDERQIVVLVVECRLTESTARQSLIKQLQRKVYEGFGIYCYVDLVAPHTLPRTSSGKLSRVAARKGFIERVDLKQAATSQAETA
jgi:fatty-acyl-CoA synthase